MKKIVVLLVIGFAVLFVFPTTQADTYRAVVIDPAGLCGLPDGNGGVYLTDDTRIVAAHSANGNSKLTCKAIGVPNDAGRAVRWDAASFGADCAISSPHGVLITDNWKATISNEGDATFTCFYRTD